jgi:hypothetical protein
MRVLKMESLGEFWHPPLVFFAVIAAGAVYTPVSGSMEPLLPGASDQVTTSFAVN